MRTFIIFVMRDERSTYVYPGIIMWFDSSSISSKFFFFVFILKLSDTYIYIKYKMELMDVRYIEK